MIQIITPNPRIPCRPGWCLQYVREAFGLPARYPTATAAWEASTSKHRDRNFPAGVAVPVWYGLHREPAGHVVLLMPDGSVYSTSDNSTTPHHHPDLADLEAFYAGWGWPLTYRGWTEDVAGYPVMTPSGLAGMGTIKEGLTVTPEQLNQILAAIKVASDEATNAKVAARDAAAIATAARNEATNAKLAARDAVTAVAKIAVAGGAAPADVDAILDGFAERLRA